MTDPEQPGTDRYRVGHFFADHGAESEVLAAIGEVVRVTIEPRETPYVTESIEADLVEETPDVQVDLGLFHPRCTDASDMTSISGDPADHANQIPRARELAQEVAEDYVIENKPRDDLRDPTMLHGRMFGLPIAYERAFETSFPVKTPARHAQLAEKTVTPYYYSDRSRDWWAAVKGYRGDYPKQHLAKNALPAVYVQTLLRSWLEARNDRDGTAPQDNNSPAPREVADDQAELPEVVR